MSDDPNLSRVIRREVSWAFHSFFNRHPECCKAVMQEKYYGLIREYLATLRVRDLCEAQLRTAPEGLEREQHSGELELTQQRCKALRREIRRYPEPTGPHHAVAPNNPPLSYKAHAG
jgi:hypothetical protein